MTLLHRQKLLPSTKKPQKINGSHFRSLKVENKLSGSFPYYMGLENNKKVTTLPNYF